jgi:hypothetical protein
MAYWRLFRIYIEVGCTDNLQVQHKSLQGEPIRKSNNFCWSLAIDNNMDFGF